VTLSSEFVPLIAWFYLSIIIIISIGTFLTSVILSIQGRRQYGRMPPLFIRYLFFTRVTTWVCLAIPPQLSMLWDELNDYPYDAYRNYRAKRNAHGRNRKEPNNLEQMSAAMSANNVAITNEVDDKLSANKSNPAMGHMSLKPMGSNNSDTAKSNWLRVGKAAAYRTRTDVPMIDISAPNSPLPTRSRHGSIWENAVTVMGGVPTPRIDSRDASVKGIFGGAVSNDVLTMKQKRQCSLEWEFLATILDRIFLVVFTLTVIIVTLGMIVTGRVAQLSYDSVENI
jgi:hypothetical protein